MNAGKVRIVKPALFLPGHFPDEILHALLFRSELREYDNLPKISVTTQRLEYQGSFRDHRP